MLAFSSLNCLTISGYKEPSLSRATFSCLTQSGNRSNMWTTDGMGESWVFSSLDLFSEAFFRHCLNQKYPFKGQGVTTCPFCFARWLNLLRIATTVCTVTLPLHFTLSSQFTAFSFKVQAALRRGRTCLKCFMERFWKNSACIHP